MKYINKYIKLILKKTIFKLIDVTIEASVHTHDQRPLRVLRSL